MRSLKILSLITFILTVFLSPLFGESEIAETKRPLTIGQRFVGEELSYEIGFWFFDNVAIGRVKLERSGRFYIATFNARTIGFVSWLRQREDTYVARLEEIDGGKRFRTLSFEEKVRVGEKERKVITVIDYKNMTMTWKKWKKGAGNPPEERVRGGGEAQIPKGVYYDDPLGAFYNFRFGVYGKMEGGKELWIKTLPKEKDKKLSDIDIYLRLANKNEFKRSFAKDSHSNYLAFVRLDKELFDSKTGDIEILFNEESIPLKAVAKDIMFFGDVRGSLVERGR